MPAKVEVKHAARLAAHLSMQREHGKYCDVCVCVGEKRFLAHKCVLSANSTKLDCLILEAIGQNSSTQDIEIEIQGVSSLGFETLLEHFYTGELNLSPQTVMPVWMTAAYLELPGVVAMCNDFCQRSVTCVSNQSTIDDGNKIQVSEANDNNSNGASVSSPASSPNVTLPPNTMAIQLPTKPDHPIEVATTKYSQMTTVTPTIKAEESHSPDLSTTSQQEKINSSDENGIVSWTSLQTATGDDFQSSNTTITQQEYEHYQSASSGWSQPQQTWPVQTFQSMPAETYTVSNTGEIIKGEVLEDGEIPVHSDEPRMIPVRPHHSEGVSFVHNISSPPASSHQGLSIVDVNKLTDVKTEKPGCENIMLEVERLRIQHQQLQRLQQQQASLNNSNVYSGGSPSVQLQVPTSYAQPQSVDVDEPVKKKAKKKKIADTTDVTTTKNDPTTTSLSNSSLPMQQAHASVFNVTLPSVSQTSMTTILDPSPMARTTPPADFKFVTDDYREVLYKKYPVKPEQPMGATCTAQELLQRGKSRKRKSTEHNTLNNTIRLILDTLEITESSDTRVEDALILIMDRFESLRASINDPTIRRSLLVKVRHSIHCKKWRVKRQMLKEKMEELGITSTDEYNKLMKQESTEDSLHGQGIDSVRSEGSDPPYSTGGSLYQKSPSHTFDIVTSDPI